jgi:hypothetical protein
MNATTVECIACHERATIKDYRERNQIIDGYPVCAKHCAMDDGNFWKAVNRKAREVR